MTVENSPSEESRPAVKRIGEPESVPVYNCVAYLSRSDSDNQVRCRCANLEGLTVAAETERDALQKMVQAFKERVAQCHQQGATVPLIDPPPKPDQHETTRYLAVHL